jgi:ribosomal protein S8
MVPVVLSRVGAVKVDKSRARAGGNVSFLEQETGSRIGRGPDLQIHSFTQSICSLFASGITLTNSSHPHLLFAVPWIATGYIGEFEIIDDHRSNKIVIELTGRLNKCGVISPRFDVAFDEIEKWIVNLLPSRQFGHILLSTTYGIMTHEEARRKKTGGKILGFFY